MKAILALLLTASALCAGTVDFRGGKVLCAELSTTAPAGLKQIKSPVFPSLPATPVYASLTFLPDDGRSISIHDYAVNIYGQNYPSVALLKEGRIISLASAANRNWKLIETPAPKSQVRYTLIFMIDGKEVGMNKDKKEKLNIKALFHPNSPVEESIEFKNIDNKPFTAPGKIPLSGLMTEKK